MNDATDPVPPFPEFALTDWGHVRPDNSGAWHGLYQQCNFLTGTNLTSSKGTWTRAFTPQFWVHSSSSLISVASSALGQMPDVVHHSASSSQSCLAEHILTDEVAAQRLVAHACELASEQPNHNPQPAYKIPAANAERMISTRKSVFLVNSSDARQNASEHVQKPYYNQSVIRNYMESSRPL